MVRNVARRLGFIAFSAFAAAAQGQVLTYPGCPAYSDGSFGLETLVKKSSGAGTGGILDPTFDEPVKLAVGKDPAGNIEVFIIQLRGVMKVYRDATKSLHVIGNMPVVDHMRREPTYQFPTGYRHGNDEEGLQGVLLDPQYPAKPRIYIFYSVPRQLTWRISRLTLNSDRLAVAREEIIYEFSVQKRECCHTGGGMQWDDLGDLYVSIGNNAVRGNDGLDERDSTVSDEWGASGTASPRGGIIRIHPLESPGPDGKLYAIPKGNFGAYWADRFAQQGRATLAAEYRDPRKVLPEIFVKGNRNPYGIAVDRVRRWVAVGDVGPDGPRPDATSLGEDHDLYLNPAFAGWPYFAGNNRKNGPNWQSKDPNAPVNTSKWNKGVRELPPAQPPLWEARNGASFAGIFYRYDKNLNSPRKLPAYFHKHVIWGNWANSGIYTARIDDNGRLVGTGKTDIFRNLSRNGTTDVQLGPDGAVYVMNYAGGQYNPGTSARLDRYSYRGTHCGADIPVEKAGCQARDPSVTLNIPEACLPPYNPTGLRGGGNRKDFRAGLLAASLGERQSLRVPPGMSRLEILDLRGRRILALPVAPGSALLRLPAGFAPGLYQVSWRP